jgi:group II intron reverse transcriptase/maturase
VWRDKLLQETIRLILDAYYEPQFNHRSHGFRPNRGCHTALAEIQRIWTGTHWFIEGDIAQCFDSLDHSTLLQILSRQIHDNRFLQLIHRFLQAGYLENWIYHASLSGAPQGSGLSPLLSNIYLNEFDKHVTGTLIPAYKCGQQRKINLAHQRICYRIRSLKSKKGYESEVKALIKQRRSMPSRDPRDPGYRRLWYCRYADDFLIGYIGSRREAEDIKAQIKTWLQEHLKLTLSDTKTLITHATDAPAHFLGYEIVTQMCQTKCTSGKRSINGRIALRVPQRVVMQRCEPYISKGKPIHRPELLANSDYSIMTEYQQIYRGIVQYYQLATNVSHLSKLRWAMEGSLLKTLAAKHQMSVSAISAKYRSSVVGADGKSRHCLAVSVMREGKKPLIAHFGGIPLKRCKSARVDDQPVMPRAYYTELEQRVRANHCEICGSQEFVEVHHIRKLADLRRTDGRKTPAWKQHMISRQRKTLVLCRECHVKLHHGSFDENLGVRH